MKRKIVVSAADARSFRVASNLLQELADVKASPNTIERICLDAGRGLQVKADENWKGVITGEAIVPEVAAVLCDGGRIRTREPKQGPGVHLNGQGWNETKNAIFVSAKSTVSEIDPEPEPPKCFFNPAHIAKLTEQAKTKEKTGANDSLPEPKKKSKAKSKRPAHRPTRLLRTVISSMMNSTSFGREMKREATRRNFSQASRKAFVADGLACNWSIHAEHFRDHVPILDFVHAVTYVYRISTVLHGRSERAWESYTAWMTAIWKGNSEKVIADLRQHQSAIGLPESDSPDDDPREQLRVVLQYLENNLERMKYDRYRMQGLPTTSAWMESTVKEVNYRIKGTEMFWNNPEGAEAILHIRAARLSDDGRLARFLERRSGSPTVRRATENPQLAA